jgi:hypothetical protein
MDIPKQDIEEAFIYSQKFEVVKKVKKGAAWESVETGVTNLENAINKAKEIDEWEAGVFTQQGILYWSSKSPELFNSPLIKHQQTTITQLDYYQIVWDVYFKVRTTDKAKKLIHKINNDLAIKIKIEHIQKHPTNDSLVQVIFSSNLHLNNVEQATFRALYLNSFLAEQWNIISPYQEGEKIWCFSGSTQNAKIQGIVSINFQVQNFIQK